MKGIRHISFICFCGLLVLATTSCKKNAEAPVVTSVSPEFGAAEDLITIEGMHLANIETLTFSGQIVNFNTAYNSDQALLYRVGTDVPLGEHTVEITTPGGSVTFPFRVTLEAPEIFNFSVPSADSGESLTIYGKNFFEPLEVLFFDSIAAEIITGGPDSVKVIIPEGIEKGKIVLKANGGRAESPVDFFRTRMIEVNDFDGNGLQANTESWIFIGAIDQTNTTAVYNENPDPIDGNFMKLSGQTDPTTGTWIGGAENPSFDPDNFYTYGITTGLGNTLLQMDINNNGRTGTNIQLILLERDGLFTDFVADVKVDWEGWERISLPLSRFENLDGVTIDPAKVKTVKIHLVDTDETGEPLEVNVDNIHFLEIL